MSLLRHIPESWKEALRLRAGAVTERSRLMNLRRAGFAPELIVDGGAYLGTWAGMARSIWPDAPLILVEPQPEMKARLTEWVTSHPPAELICCALGRQAGEARLLLQHSNSRLDGDVSPVLPGVTVPVKTLREVLDKRQPEGRVFLKLDVQGSELDVLKGAGDWFGRCEVLQLEVSWLQIGEPPLLTEVMEVCTGRGYVPYDVWGQNYRPLDGALWQTDFLWVRRDSTLLASRSFS